MRIRTGLRTDLVQRPGAAVLHAAIPVALDGDCGACGVSAVGAVVTPDPDPGGYFPSFTLRSRSRRFTDDDGVVRYSWQTVYSGQVVMRDVDRNEISDAAGQALVRAVLDVPAPEGEQAPRETVTAWDEAGRQWTVTKLDDQGVVWSLSVERVDDGEQP